MAYAKLSIHSFKDALNRELSKRKETIIQEEVKKAVDQASAEIKRRVLEECAGIAFNVQEAYDMVKDEFNLNLVVKVDK